MSLSFYSSSTNVSMNHNLISCSRWFSWLLSHVNFPVALHILNVIPPPRHHERVHRHLPAQPRAKLPGASAPQPASNASRIRFTSSRRFKKTAAQRGVPSAFNHFHWIEYHFCLIYLQLIPQPQVHFPPDR